MSAPLNNSIHEANVRRYRRLLQTHLTELERRFLERRLAEEQLACHEGIANDRERKRAISTSSPQAC